MAFLDNDKLISPFSAKDRKRPAARKGWSASKISGAPEMEIYRVWGKPTRHLHHLKANTTDFFMGDEHIAHVRWRVIEHILTMKKPPKGYVVPRPSRESVEAQIRAYRETIVAGMNTSKKQ